MMETMTMPAHGGDWAGYEMEYGTLPLDFSANLSPLGMPEGVRLAAEAAIERAGRYPDPQCRALRGALAAQHGLPASHIVCGAGAADLIFRLPLALRPAEALLPVPSFSEYEAALLAAGCRVQHHVLREEEDFSLTREILPRIVPGLDLLILCNPNNPTGRIAEPALLREILERCGETGTTLLVDECFVELLQEPETHSLAAQLPSAPGLILLRAFTKSHAMAGLRLGYALCGSEGLAERLQRCGQAWPVSVPAQEAGLAALRERQYMEEVCALLRAERPFLASGLAALGCRCVPGEANFILFQHEDFQLREKLRRRGILLRDCCNFVGLGPGWYRAAVRTHGENETFLQRLKEVLEHG